MFNTNHKSYAVIIEEESLSHVQSRSFSKFFYEISPNLNAAFVNIGFLITTLVSKEVSDCVSQDLDLTELLDHKLACNVGNFNAMWMFLSLLISIIIRTGQPKSLLQEVQVIEAIEKSF